MKHSLVFRLLEIIFSKFSPWTQAFVALAAGSIVLLIGKYSGLAQFILFFLFLFLLLVRTYKNFTVPLLVLYVLLSQFDVGWGRPLTLAQFVHPDGTIQRFSVWLLFTYADVVLLLLLVFALRAPRGQKRPDKIALLLAAFFAWNALSSLFSFRPDASIVGLLALLRGGIVYGVFSRLVRRSKEVSAVVWALVGVLLFQGAWGLYQFIQSGPTGHFFDLASFKSGVEANVVAGAGVSLFRASGTFPDPNVFALYLLMLLPISVYILLHNKTAWPIALSAALVGVGAIILSSSRTGFLLLAVLTLFILRAESAAIVRLVREGKNSKRAILLVFLTVLSLGFYALPHIIIPRVSHLINQGVIDPIIASRIDLIKESIAIIQTQPILGIGPNNFVPHMVMNNVTGISRGFLAEVHNIYLLIAAETGLPGLMLFLLLVRKIMQKIPRKKILLWGIFSFLLFGLFVPSYVRGPQFLLFMILVGLIGAV